MQMNLAAKLQQQEMSCVSELPADTPFHNEAVCKLIMILMLPSDLWNILQITNLVKAISAPEIKSHLAFCQKHMEESLDGLSVAIQEE